MFGIGAWKHRLPQRDEALPGREQPLLPGQPHHVHGRSLLTESYPHGEMVLFGMGCFWGAERKFWSLPGVLMGVGILIGVRVLRDRQQRVGVESEESLDA